MDATGLVLISLLAVVLGFDEVWEWHAATRLRRTAVWDTVQLVANGSIFVLLGEQLPTLLAAAPATVLLTGHRNPAWLAGYAVIIVVALAALRFGWVWTSLRLALLDARRRGGPAPAAGWRVVLATSLAGVRGAVTLAAVMTWPLVLRSGEAFPARELAVLLAAGVIVLSMVLAMVALPPTLRGLELPAEAPPRAAEHRARQAAAQAALRAVEADHLAMTDTTQDVRRLADTAARVMAMYRQRIDRCGKGDSPAQLGRDDLVEKQLRLAGLRAERDEVLRSGREREIDELTLRKLVRELDHQETRVGS